MFLRDAVLQDFPGNYTRARQLLVEHDLAAAKARETEEAEIKRLQRRAKRLATWGKLWDNEKFLRRAKGIEKKKATVTYVAPEDCLTSATEFFQLLAQALAVAQRDPAASRTLARKVRVIY